MSSLEGVPLVSGVHPETVLRMMGIEPSEVSTAAGTIGLVSQPLARYTDFWLSFFSLVRPATTKLAFRQGMDVTGNYNGLIEDMQGDWLWIMGDDHTFPPDVLMRLIAHEVDVVVPLCLKKDAPFDPVVYEGEEGVDEATGLTYHRVARLEQHGLQEIYAAGTAGMLISRHVIEALDKPVFTTSHGVQNEDLLFCKKVREAGFKIYCDVDVGLGHIAPRTVYPNWMGDRWGAVLDCGNGHWSPFLSFTQEEIDAMLEEAGLEPDVA